VIIWQNDSLEEIMIRSLLLGTLVAVVAVAQEPKSVLIITDAEGVAGICRQDQTVTSNPELQKLLTGEINAAVRGFRRAGATDVWVWDGHSNSSTLSTLTVEGARLVQGSLGPKMLLDRKFAAVAFVGQHARANREKAVMAHSYSSLGIQKILMNGKEVGEIETRTALAGWFNTPVIYLSGDQAAADDLLAIVPQAVVSVVKEGLGYYACVSMAAGSAQAKIEADAAKAWAKLGSIAPYRVAGPVEIEVESTTRSTPSPDSVLPAGVERVGPRTMRFKGADFFTAWALWASR
jgi:D-amino peptidase